MFLAPPERAKRPAELLGDSHVVRSHLGSGQSVILLVIRDKSPLKTFESLLDFGHAMKNSPHRWNDPDASRSSAEQLLHSGSESLLTGQPLRIVICRSTTPQRRLEMIESEEFSRSHLVPIIE